MTTNEIKNILTKKFEDEGCCFTKKDISIKRNGKGDNFTIVVADYDHAPIKITTEVDDYFGNCIWVRYEFEDEVQMFDSKTEWRWESAIKNVGYYVATRF